MDLTQERVNRDGCSTLDVSGLKWDSLAVNGEKDKNGWTYLEKGFFSHPDGRVYFQTDHPDVIESIIELSECPCDPRRRHERLGQKVAVV